MATTIATYQRKGEKRSSKAVCSSDETCSQSLDDEYESDEVGIQMDVENTQEEVSFVPSSEIDSEPPKENKKRGITCCNAVVLATKDGEKLEVYIPPTETNAVGENARKLVSYCGVIVKKHAKLSAKSWDEVEETIGEKMCSLVEEKFKSKNDERQKLRGFILKKLKGTYTTWCYHMRQKLQNLSESERETHVPKGVDIEDWKQAVVNWGSGDFKVMSDRNKKNRSQVKVKNACGSKSHDEVAFDMRDPITGMPKPADEVWRAQHTKKNKEGKVVWCDEESKAIYEKIKQIIKSGQKLSNKEIILQAKGKSSSRRVKRAKTILVGEEVRAEIRREIYNDLNQEFQAKLEEQNKKWEKCVASVKNQHEEDMRALVCQ